MARTGPAAVRGALRDWFDSGPGRMVLDAELAAVERALANLFGYHLIRVGHLPGRNAMVRSRVLNRAIVALDGDQGEFGFPTTRGCAAALPIDSDSVDVVLLEHVLEFEPDPHAALREAFRVLVPEGHVIISAFNPWSLFGLWSLAARARRELPWRGGLLARRRLGDWLGVLGFEVMEQAACFFGPPVGNEALLRRLGWLGAAGLRLLPMCAGSFVVVARKQVTALTPIRPRWRPSRRLMPVGLAGPSARVPDSE